MNKNLCFFYNQGELVLAILKSLAKNKAYVIHQSTDSLNTVINKSQIYLSWQDDSLKIDKFLPAELNMFLMQLNAKLEQAIKNLDLNAIYKKCTPNHPYSVYEVYSIATKITSGYQKQLLIGAIINKIKHEKYLFRYFNNLIFARDNADIKIIKHKEKLTQHQQITENEHAKWLTAISTNQMPDLDTSSSKKKFDSFIKQLIEFAKDPQNCLEKTYFSKLLEVSLASPSYKIEYKVIDIIKKAGVNMSWGQLLMSKTAYYNIKNSSPAIINKQFSAVDITNHLTGYKDETQLTCYSVDPILTKDFDDAISLENAGSTVFIRLHVSDVSRIILPDSDLFKRCEYLKSSIYTPKKVFNMLPDVLAENKLALLKGTPKAVLTFCWELDETDLHILNFTIYKSIILVKDNLNFDQVDQFLKNQDPFWLKIKAFCDIQTAQRKKKGSVSFNHTTVKLDICEPDNIKIIETLTNSAAAKLIEEISIQANAQTGRLIKNNLQAALYRIQPKKNFTNLQSSPHLKSHSGLLKSYLGLNPMPHYGLAVEQYARNTAPIRRFDDLVNQIILSHLINNQKPTFTKKQLWDWAWQTDKTLKNYRNIEHSLLTHWKYKYLAQNTLKVFELVAMKKNWPTSMEFNIKQLNLNVTLPSFYNSYKTIIQARLTKVNITERSVTFEII